MRISTKLSPWAIGGGLAGGVAEGAYMGSQMAAQRTQSDLARQQLDLQKQAQYYQLLQAAIKAGEMDPEVGQALWQKAVAGIPGGGAGMPTPSFDPSKLAERQATGEAAGISAKMAKAKQMQLPEGSPQWFAFVYGKFPPKEGRQYPQIEVPGYGPMDADIAVKFLKLQQGGGKDGGGGGGEGAYVVVPDPESPEGFKIVPTGLGRKAKMINLMGPLKDKPDPFKVMEITTQIEKDFASGQKAQAIGGIEKLNALGQGTASIDKKTGKVTWEHGRPRQKPPTKTQSPTQYGTTEEPPG